MAGLLPQLKFRPLDLNGAVVPGGKLHSYINGTTTRIATYTDESGDTPHTNPIILDANGEAEIWLSNTTYKFIFTDADDNELYTINDVRLPQAGERGSHFLTGNGVPDDDDDGQDGDSWLDIDTGDVYQKASGLWGSPIGQIAMPLTDNQVTTAKIINDAVTFAKMQNIATDRLIGRDTAGSGSPEEISVGGGLEFSGSTGIQRSALTGDVTANAGSNATTIPNDTVTNAKLNNMAAWTIKARNNAASGDPQDVALADLTEDASPSDGDFVLGMLSTGELRKYNVSNIGSGGGGSGFTFVSHAVTDGQSATNLSAETVDGDVYSSCDFYFEIIRGTTVVATGIFALHYVNGSWRITEPSYRGDDHGVTFSFTQTLTVAQLEAALDVGAGDGTIKIAKVRYPI